MKSNKRVIKKTPVPYYGGKSRLANRIVQLIPKHIRYVEPFFGGGAVFFSKPRPDVSPKHYREVINDKNELLINFYRVYRDRPAELIHRIDKTLYSASEYKEAERVLKTRDADEVTMAWAIYVSLTQSFSNRMGGGFRRSRVSSDLPSIFRNQVSRLQLFEHRLQKVIVECSDAIDIIYKWDSPDTFFYVDPPYPGCEQGHYRGYTQEDFEGLIAVLRKVKGSFILSHYDNPAIPATWERFEFSNYCAGRKRKHGTEYLYRKVRKTGHSATAREVFNSGKLDCFAA